MPAYIHHGRVAFHETDAARIVHFAQFFRYAEEAETHALDSLGLIDATSSAGMLIPRVHVEADYLRPLRFWDAYQVHAHIKKMGDSSVQWQFDIKRGAELCAIIRWVSARLDAKGQKAAYTEQERGILSTLM